MARPGSKNVDYFPCYCKDGKVLFVLESRWGNNGYAFFYKLWKRLGDADYHYIDLRPIDNWEYFRAKMGVSDSETTDILNKLAEMGIIDPELWSQRVIWSESFLESVADVWRKRKQLIPQKPTFLIQKPGLPQQKSAETIVSGIDNPQRIGKESKGNNIPSNEGISLSETSDTSSRPIFPEAPPEVSPETPSEETRCPHDQIIKLYREILPELPAVQEWTKERQALLRTRWKEKMERQSLEWWRQYFVRIRGSDFLMGRTDNGFVCNLEWLIRPKNMPKVLEGNYANRKGNGDGRRQYFGAGPGKTIGTAGLAKSDTEPYPVDYEF
jgi:hypothetical protein